MTDIQADVIVVGAGVAGALLADRLASRGIRVAMLDAGPRVDRAQALKQYREALIKVPESPYMASAKPDHPIAHEADHWYRQAGPDTFKSTYLKVVGGTTWHWLGTCLRYLPSDFQLASRYGRGADWPLAYDELEPFYLQAEHELGVAGDAEEDLDSPRSGPFPMPPIALSYLDGVFAQALEGSGYRVSATPQARNSEGRAGRPACCGSASCIPICPIGAKYDATMHVNRAEGNGAALYENTTATHVETAADGDIAAVVFRRPDGSEGRARGRVYVIAAHGVETPRLLLNSRTEALPAGVANRSDQVGRNLMDHPIQLSWALSREPVWPYRGPISTAGIENLRDGPEREARASLRIQISGDGWNWPVGGPDVIAEKLARQGLRGTALREALRHHVSRQIQIAALTEQLPDPANRIALHAHDRDRFGVPLPQMHYRVDEYSLAGLAAAKTIHDRIFARLGATEIGHKAEFEGSGHIIGTCVMGKDPKASVVNAELRSHDHRNLFIVGSAVFPTSGTANPTLTIAALSLRAADRIRRHLHEAGGT